MKPALRQFVIEYVASRTRTFGGGTTSHGNPIAEALKGCPPCFAAGVDVGDVVDLVFEAVENASSAAKLIERDVKQLKSRMMEI